MTATHKEPVAIPGTTTTAPSLAITITATAQQGLLKQPINQTFHEFYVDRTWRYSVSEPEQFSPNC